MNSYLRIEGHINRLRSFLSRETKVELGQLSPMQHYLAKQPDVYKRSMSSKKI